MYVSDYEFIEHDYPLNVSCLVTMLIWKTLIEKD